MEFERPQRKEEKTPVDALVDFAKGLKASEGLKESEIRRAAEIALNKQDDEVDANAAGSPDTELAETLKKALEARRGIPPGPVM